MTSRSALGLAACAALAIGLSATGAEAGRCDRGFAAQARVANGLNYDPPRAYDATALARSRAIGLWKMKVRTLCPDHSAFWWRAFEKDVSCEGYAGGIGCRVAARPAHKFFR
jgi:hypothetical protein